jgi:starch synthase (maltosyl-transferring)
VTGRLVIEDIRPRTPSSGHFAKAVVGEMVRASAVVFKDGHDRLTGRVLLFAGKRKVPESVGVLTALGDDEWESVVVPKRIGPHRLVVEAWTDPHATWAHKVQAKLEAGQPIDLEIAEGLALLDSIGPNGTVPAVTAAQRALLDASLEDAARVGPALEADVAAALWGPALAPDLTSSPSQPLWVDRERALYRSVVRVVAAVVRRLQGGRGAGTGPGRHGVRRAVSAPRSIPSARRPGRAATTP